MEILSISYDEYLKFKLAYKMAVDAKKSSFEFKDREFLVGFAKYYIEYLDRKFKK